MEIVFIFIPGILWEKIDKTFSAKIKPDTFSFIVRSFIFGIISYSITYIIYIASGHGSYFIHFDISDKGTNYLLQKNNIICISIATLTSLILSLFWVYIHKNKSFNKITQKIKLTQKYGDEDVWDYTLNRKTINNNKIYEKYITVYDYGNDIIYCGYLDSFSETDKERELFIVKAHIYNSEGKKLYELENLYLGLDKTSVCMEIKEIVSSQGTIPPSP